MDIKTENQGFITEANLEEMAAHIPAGYTVAGVHAPTGTVIFDGGPEGLLRLVNEGGTIMKNIAVTSLDDDHS